MEILASTISSTIIEIGKCLYVPVERHIGYLIAYKRNVDTLRSQVQKLGTIRDDVKRVIELAQCRGEVIKGVVEEWIIKVERIEEEARSFDDEVNENKRCFGGWCPNFRSRYGLGKKAKKKVVEVNLLQQEGEFSVVSDPAPHPSFESIPTRDFLDFGSTKSAMNKIKDALKDEKIKVVGVYGLGGVGKTSLMEQVGKQMKNENLYNEVVKVTVSQNPVLKNIQDEIAEKIGLKIDETSEEARAARLHARLKQLTRVLLILDDLWSLLELSKVGIPKASEYDGCQIVLTTRNLQVCTAMMSQATIEVKLLSADDSWLLFKKYAGDFIESPSFRTVAKNVVKECGGLPLAIVTLGRALREKGVSYWDDALVQLKRSNPTEIIGMDTEVFRPLMFSYNALGSEEMKSCFLFCCLFPEDYNIEIEHLLQYGIGEGLYRGALTLNEARGRVRILVENLKARCLLLEGDTKEYVKMHDILRDLAIKISSANEDKFLVKARQGLERWPEREEVDKCYKISLMYNAISILPDQPPTCPKLRTLILSNNGFYLEVIPDNFFEGMKNLVVLDLSDTYISYLPSSFSCLTNLRTLRLEVCHALRNMSSLGGLTKLEILCLRGTWLNRLPEEIGELTNLKLLDLEDNYDLEIVPPNVLSRLTFLEELYMENSFSKWGLQGKGPGHNASFAEVASLAYLTVLHVYINDVEILSQEISCRWKNLTEFHIKVAKSAAYVPVGQKCTLRLEVCGPIANWVKELAERTQELHLKVDNNFVEVVPLINRNPNSLKTLHFNVQQEREHLIKVEDFPENAFSRLERLYLSNLGKVKKLCEGPIPSGFFANLKHLDLSHFNNLRYLWPFFPCHSSQKLESLFICRCEKMEGLIPRKEEESVVMDGIASPMLSESHTRNSPNFLPPLLTFQNLRRLHISFCPNFKYIFSWKFANGLNQLEQLQLLDCDGMEVIFAEVGMVDSGVLPQLKALCLRQLRRLVSFFQGEASLDMTSLEIIIIKDCENLKRLPLGTQSAPNLKEFHAEEEWFEALEWREGSITKSRLQPLFKDTPRMYRARRPVIADLSNDDHAETSAVEADSESFDQAEPTPAIETGMSDQAAETFANEADSRVDSESGPESMH